MGNSATQSEIKWSFPCVLTSVVVRVRFGEGIMGNTSAQRKKWKKKVKKLLPNSNPHWMGGVLYDLSSGTPTEVKLPELNIPRLASSKSGTTEGMKVAQQEPSSWNARSRETFPRGSTSGSSGSYECDRCGRKFSTLPRYRECTSCYGLVRRVGRRW